jgi:hypothetical protein
MVQSARRRRSVRERALIGTEVVTGAAASIGGVLLAARPDGSLLKADRSALSTSPFTDWRLPGALLAVLVGGGFLGAAAWHLRDGAHAREVSLLAGAGLIAFEGTELKWIGFQPLEGVFAGVGLLVIGLAWRTPPRSRAPKGPREAGRSTVGPSPRLLEAGPNEERGD